MTTLFEKAPKKSVSFGRAGNVHVTINFSRWSQQNSFCFLHIEVWTKFKMHNLFFWKETWRTDWWIHVEMGYMRIFGQRPNMNTTNTWNQKGYMIISTVVIIILEGTNNQQNEWNSETFEFQRICSQVPKFHKGGSKSHLLRAFSKISSSFCRWKSSNWWVNIHDGSIVGLEIVDIHRWNSRKYSSFHEK